MRVNIRKGREPGNEATFTSLQMYCTGIHILLHTHHVHFQLHVHVQAIITLVQLLHILLFTAHRKIAHTL